MKDTLQAGITTTRRIDIDAGRTISFMGDDLRIYATPSMVLDVEHTALDLVAEHLDEGESSVGIHVSIDHLGATPLGSWVDVTITVAAVEGRKLDLEVEVRDPLEQVGRGRHSRFVVEVARQAERLRAKVDKLAG